MIYTEGSSEPATGIDKVWDVDNEMWTRRPDGWSFEHGDAYPWPYPLAWAPLDDRKDPPSTSAQVGALTRAIRSTDIPGQRQAVDIATDLLAALDALGWRLIHD